MEPNQANPNNFKIKNILFNNSDFSIAYGTWQKESDVLAMRWNGDNNNPNDAGYPKVFGHPMWFVIPNDLALTFVKSLINEDNSNLEEIFTVIKELV